MIDDVTDTWLGRAIREACAGAARDLETDNDASEDDA